MEVTREAPGPKIGMVLSALLEEVLDNPDLNTSEYLETKAKELIQLPIEALAKLGESGQEKKAEVEQAELKKINKKYGV